MNGLKFELKPLVAASLSQKAIDEVNQAFDTITNAPMQDQTYIAKLSLQHHLFDVVPTRTEDLDEP